MYFYKKYLIASIIFFISTTATHSIENKILYKINNNIITSLDLKKETNYLMALNPTLQNLPKKNITEISKKSLIKEKIKYIELSKYIDEIDVNKDYLNQFIKSIYQKLNLNSLNEFKNYLKKFKVEIETVESKIQIEIAWNELIYAKFSEKLIIDRNKIEKKIIFKNSNTSKEYLISEILFEVDNKDELSEKYRLIEKDISEKTFKNAASIHSISSSSSLGGNLGWINIKSLNAKIKKEVLNIKIGSYTKPILIPGGFLILKVNDIREVKENINIKDEVDRTIRIKTNEQLNQLSNIYFNKVKKEIQINEL